MIFVDSHQDDGDAHASGQSFKVTGYPFSTFLRVILEVFSGEALCTADDEGSDEAAVDDAGGFAKNNFKLGILLVQDIDGTDSLLLRDQGFYSFFVTVQGNAEDRCVPLLAQIGRHLGDDEGFAHFVSGGDTLYTTLLVDLN